MSMITARWLFLASVAFTTVITVKPATALVSAYVLFDSDDSSIQDKLMIGLSNCKQLLEADLPGPIVAHISCNDLESLNQAVTDMSEVDGVLRALIWIIDTNEAD